MAAQTPNSDKKTISSRLASMKFMQRGIASETSSPTNSVDPGDRSAKRRKSSHVVTSGEIAPPVIDRKAVQATLEKEEQRRQVVIKKQAEEAGDSHWVLPGPFPQPDNGRTLEAPLKIRYVTQAQIDHGGSDEEDTSDSEKAWRKKPVFRRYNMPDRKPVTTPATTGDGDVSDNSDGSEPSRSVPASKRSADQKLKRKRSSSEFSTRRKAENERAHKFAEERRRKEVRLNQPASISGFGDNTGPPKCFACGKTGHKATRCPFKRPVGNRS